MATAKTQLTEAALTVLKRPLVTEKTTQIAEGGNWLVFEVEKTATKPQIRSAVENLYGVNVTQVNTLISKGKTKGFGARAGRRSDVKKALVKLKDGQSVDLMAGVK
ncbi:MAG: 50S ribosomal protein L23 [Pseudomonadaceae bacterium]|nr:50S ribosomal protein L23 [Pseudomonadaceae bacterium]